MLRKIAASTLVIAFAFLASSLQPLSAENAAPPNLDKDKKKELESLIQDYFNTTELSEQLKLIHKIRRFDPLNKSDFKKFKTFVWKLVAQRPKPDKVKGTLQVKSPFGETQVIVSGSAHPKNGGIFLGLHGGGAGSGDGSAAAGIYGGMQNCVSLFPTAINKIDNAWNDPPQERFLIWLLKYIRRASPCNTNRIYVGGHSMGGHGAYGQLLQYADIYAAGMPSAGNPLVEDTADHYGDARKLAENLYNTGIYFMHSKDDPRVAYEPVRLWAEALKKLKKDHPDGYDYVFSEYEDIGHDLPKEGIKTLMDWCWKHVRNPYPKTIRWQMYRPWKRHFYWLYCYQPERLQLIVGEMPEQNTFKVTCKDYMGKLSVMMNEEFVDFDKPVAITVNGKEVFNSLPSYSISALVSSVDEYEDPAMEFTSRVDFEVP
ncbi:MAG: hypothetical protein Kow00107_04300 [Planctomycetota bacterium]